MRFVTHYVEIIFGDVLWYMWHGYFGDFIIC